MAEKKATEQTCTICLELFTEPKLLPCCHTFCKRCLEGILDKAQEKEKLACPQCRAEHLVPSSGPDDFPNDYTLPESHSTRKRKTARPTCEQCDQQGLAVSYCSECSADLCESCTSAHKTIKFLKTHNIEAISPGPSEPHPPTKKPRTIYCPQHPDRVFELYCKNCQCVVCILCIVSSHNGHTLGNIDSETREEIEGQIKDLATKAETKLDKFHANLDYINIVDQEKEEDHLQIETDINDSFNKLLTEIKLRKAALLKEAKANHIKDLEELSAQKKLMEKAISGLTGTLSFANRSLQCDHDLQLLLSSEQALASLTEQDEMIWDSESTEAIDLTLYEYTPADLSTLGEIKLSTLEPDLYPVIEDPSSVALELGQPVTIVIKIGTGSKRNKGLQVPQLDVEILHGKVQIEVPYPPDVMYNQTDKTWSVKFIPIVSGTHTLHVRAKLLLGETFTQKENESTINVTGMPDVGDRVQRGPDWSFGSEDGFEGNDGSVISRLLSESERDNDLVIQWDDDDTEHIRSNNETYLWGKDGQYYVQLVPLMTY